MMFFKMIEDGYITAIGKGTKGTKGTEITEAEYGEILAVIRSKPKETEATDYRLRENLTWEEYEVEPPDPDPDIDDAELLTILMGGTTE